MHSAAMIGATTIGICEHDAGLRSVLVRAFADEGFEVRAVDGGRLAVQEFSASPPDVLVLEVELPDADGREVCRTLRARGVEAPVIFLSARAQLADRLAGFHAGGDDYLIKPFALAELVVRVRALLKRAGAEPEPLAIGELRLDPGAHGVRVGDRSEALTPTEYRVLAALAARRGDVVWRAELMLAAWPAGAIVHANTLDAYIGRLRRKLRELGAETEIATARGVGYTLR
jgi:two-component system OmpR family response regulator